MQIAGQSLLYTASCALNVQFVELLFDLGADPNVCESKRLRWTTWEAFLWIIRNSSEALQENLGQMADIIQLFLWHGADVRVTVDDLTLDDLINERFRHWNAARTDDLLSKVVVAKTTKRPQN
jgi:hypothetical protein